MGKRKSGASAQAAAVAVGQAAPAAPPASATPEVGKPGPLTPEEKAVRAAKREANKKSQLPYQIVLSTLVVESGQPAPTVNSVVGALKAVIGKALLGGSVVMLGPDLGSFKVIATEARKGRNPRTGETIDVPAGKRVRFQPGSALKTLLMTGQAAVRPSASPVPPASATPATPATPGVVGTELPAGIPGQSERARKIAAKKAAKKAQDQVASAVPQPSVSTEAGGAVPESSVSDADIDSILNESLGEGEEDVF